MLNCLGLLCLSLTFLQEIRALRRKIKPTFTGNGLLSPIFDLRWNKDMEKEHQAGSKKLRTSHPRPLAL